MPLSSRIRTHLQSHIVGYLALFVALSGTALALPGQKQVKSNDLADGAVKGKAIAANAVSAPKLQASSVDATKIVDGTITAAELGAGAVGSTQLAPGSVIGDKIGQGEINGDKLANSAVDSSKVANETLLAEDLAAGAVDSSKVANETLLAEDLAAGAVDSSKVANGTLLAEDFAAGQISHGFAVSTTPNLSGTPFDLVFANQTIPRSGRLLVMVSLFAELGCAAACQLDLALYVDNTLVPGSTVTLGASCPCGGGPERTQPRLSGILPVTAGNHTIRLRGDAATNADSFNPTNVSFTGILLQ